MTTATSLAAKVLATIRRHGLFHGGETVLVAVSGGADSVALFDLLRELAPALRLSLHVAHVHHGLRAEADADADFVRGLCGALGAPFHLDRVEVRSGPPWEGLEAEARRARYAALLDRARALGADRIATGHTADDQAETVLMRLLGGAGPRGLAGIAPARGLLIRPLLETRRSEIEARLRERGLDWVEDRTNRDPRFLRNRIRHEVLPFLGELWGADVVESLCRSAAVTRRWVAEVEERARGELGRLAARGPVGLVFPAAELRSLPEELAFQVLLLAAAELGEARPLRGAAQRAARRLLGPAPGRRSARLGRLALELSGRWLRVGPIHPAGLAAREWTVPGIVELPEVGLRLEARRFERPEGYAPPREPDRVAFDADRLPPSLVVRARRAGDRFVPFAGAGERRLKSFFIDAGVPRWDRPRVPLIEARGEIIWVAGLRRGQTAPVTPESRCILEVTLRSL
ncbi:MAG TPA: tRNA lysidine(34) synthetase TilS [Methylomirabilota bacterium]|nr:tRNA lysidine(34) synthetase TilS [Methylomirabilota bacterium]